MTDYERRCKTQTPEKKEQRLEMVRKWRKQHPHKVRQYNKKHAEQIKAAVRRWDSMYPERRKACAKLWWDSKGKHDPLRKIRNSLRSNFHRILNTPGATGKSLLLLGCSHDELVRHLESQFNEQMSWSNYGTFWEIDHIWPVSRCDPTRDEDLKKCFHFSNMRPLSKSANRSKANKLL